MTTAIDEAKSAQKRENQQGRVRQEVSSTLMLIPCYDTLLPCQKQKLRKVQKNNIVLIDFCNCVPNATWKRFLLLERSKGFLFGSMVY